MSGAIHTPQGEVLLKLTGRRKALTRSFDEVKQQIRNQLYRDKRQESMESFVKGLREKASVKIDEGKLAKVQIEGAGPGQYPGPGLPPVWSGWQRSGPQTPRLRNTATVTTQSRSSRGSETHTTGGSP